MTLSPEIKDRVLAAEALGHALGTRGGHRFRCLRCGQVHYLDEGQLFTEPCTGTKIKTRFHAWLDVVSEKLIDPLT